MWILIFYFTFKVEQSGSRTQLWLHNPCVLELAVRVFDNSFLSQNSADVNRKRSHPCFLKIESLNSWTEDSNSAFYCSYCSYWSCCLWRVYWWRQIRSPASSPQVSLSDLNFGSESANMPNVARYDTRVFGWHLHFRGEKKYRFDVCAGRFKFRWNQELQDHQTVRRCGGRVAAGGGVDRCWSGECVWGWARGEVPLRNSLDSSLPTVGEFSFRGFNKLKLSNHQW